MKNISPDNTIVKKNIYYKIYFNLFYYFLSIKKREKLKNRPIQFFLDSKSIVSDFFSLKIGIKKFVGNDIFEKIHILANENESLRLQLQKAQKNLDVARENEFLQLQLHQVQEELEQYFLKNKELKSEKDSLAVQLDARTKERNSLSSEKDALAKDHEQLKKSTWERAARIAELEAQVADQAERGKLIDEQMLRAEAQLEMLKEFLQPASR
jgi:hypothetical protein